MTEDQNCGQISDATALPANLKEKIPPDAKSGGEIVGAKAHRNPEYLDRRQESPRHARRAGQGCRCRRQGAGVRFGPQDRSAGGPRFDRQPFAGGDLAQPGWLVLDQESFAAKQLLASRSRASILAALHQSQTSGDPSQLSLGILNAYSSMSSEERQAVNWTPSFRDNAVASYKSTKQILSMLRGA